MKTLQPVLVTDLFPGERARLLNVLSGLSDDLWRRPTVCPGWSVKDIALHLLGGDIGVLSRKRDGFQGTVASRENSSKAGLVERVNQLNEEWIVATRRTSPRPLCELLRFTGEATSAYFKSLDPMARGETVSWAGPEPAPRWLDTAREYTERWHHQQHIRDAVGEPGLKSPRWFGPVLDTFVRAVPHTFRDVRATNGTLLRLKIAGDSGGEWFVERLEDSWLLGIEADSRPDAEVSIDQEVAWRLFTKGFSKEDAMKSATFAGDRKLAQKILDVVSIIA